MTSQPSELPEWELLLMADPGAEEWAEQWERDESRQRHAEREFSIAYAAENGWDMDPVTGRYLPPASERE